MFVTSLTGVGVCSPGAFLFRECLKNVSIMFWKYYGRLYICVTKQNITHMNTVNEQPKQDIYLPVGTRVERIDGGYVQGRQGNVVEVNGDRRRVGWDTEPGGSPIINTNSRKPSVTRTWVNIRSLKKI